MNIIRTFRSSLYALALVVTSHARGDDLLAVYARALEQDPAIHEAEAKRDATREARPQSLARLLPSLAITGSVGGNWYSTTSTYIIGQLGTQEFWDSTLFLKFSQPIYHNEYFVQLSQSENQIAQAEAEYAFQQQELIIRTAKAYFGVLAARDNLEFARAERRSLEDVAKKTQQRFDAGTVPITDLLEAQAAFDLAVAGENAAVRGVNVARMALREIIGNQEPELTPLRKEWPLAPPAPGAVEPWNQMSRLGNLSILAALNAVEVARKNIALQFSGHLPSLDLVGNVGYQDTNRPFGLNANSQTIGVQLTIPLVQGGAVNSRVREAGHELRATEEALDKRRREVDRLVQDAFDGVSYAITQVRALGTAIGSAERALLAAQLGLQAGTRTMADVLTMERNLYRSRRDHAQARYDYILQSLLLKQAGGVLSSDDVRLVNTWLDSTAAKP